MPQVRQGCPNPIKPGAVPLRRPQSLSDFATDEITIEESIERDKNLFPIRPRAQLTLKWTVDDRGVEVRAKR